MLGCQVGLGPRPGGLWFFPEIFVLWQMCPGICSAHGAWQSSGSAAVTRLLESRQHTGLGTGCLSGSGRQTLCTLVPRSASSASVSAKQSEKE